MANSYIQLPPDSTGKKLQTWDNTIGGSDVYAEGVVVVDSTGTEKATASNPLRVDPVGTTTQPISGTVTAEIVGHAGSTLDGTAGSPSTGVLTVQGVGGGTNVPVSQGTAANLNATVVGTGTFVTQSETQDGSGNGITSNSTATAGKRGLDVNILSVLGTAPAAAGVLDENVKNIAGNAVSTAATGVQKVGIVGNAGAAVDAATAASPPANAIQTGDVAATTSLPTAVSSGQLVAPMADKFGRAVILQNAPRGLVGTQATTITSSTAATTVVTAGASGVFTDIVSLTITNSSTTALIVTLSDGTNSFIFALAANGGITMHFPTPLPATSTATAWTLTCGTSVASIYVVAIFINNK